MISLSVVLSWPADAIRPRSLITHPDACAETRARVVVMHTVHAAGAYTHCVGEWAGANVSGRTISVQAGWVFVLLNGCGSDRVLHATHSLAQVSCADPCRLSGVPTDGCSEHL